MTRLNRAAIIASIAVLILLVPVLVNLLFSITARFPIFEAKWDAGSLLVYIATIIAAAAALTGVVLTIKHSRESINEQLKKQAMPYVALMRLERKGLKSHFMELNYGGQNPLSMDRCNGEEQYVEYESKQEYLVIGERIRFVSVLDPWLQEAIEYHDEIHRNSSGGFAFSRSSVLYQPFLVKNVGFGPAIDFEYGLYRADTPIDDRHVTIPRALGSGEDLRIGLIVETNAAGAVGDYVLTLLYEDIYANRYGEDFGVQVVGNPNEEGEYLPVEVRITYKKKLSSEV